MSLTVQIVAPDRELWSGAAQRVIAPTTEGEIGLLVGHEPILALLKAGQVRVLRDGGDTFKLDVTGGFLSFDHDSITIVADTEAPTGE